MTTVPSAIAANEAKSSVPGAQGVRESGASSAPPRGKRTPEGEFGAMLVLAGLAGMGGVPGAPAAGSAKSAMAACGGGEAKGRGDATGKGVVKGDTPQTAGSLAAHAMGRSQADELRTIGRGVSLSALAQAELRGDGAGGAPGAAEAANGHVSGPRSEGSDPTARGVANAESRPGEAGESPRPEARSTASHAMLDPGRASGLAAARAAQPAASNALAALDRLSSASSRAIGAQAMRPAGATGAAGAPAAGAVTAASKLIAVKSTETASTPGVQSAPAKHDAVHAEGARTTSTKPAAAHKAAEAPPPRSAEQTQFTVQVHRALGQALQARDGVVTIHLTPEHLGRLRVDLSRSDDGVSARFEAQTPEARGLLERSMPELKAALEARGLHVDRLDVRLTEPPAAERAGDQGEHAAGDTADETGQDGRPQGGGAPSHEQRSAADAGGGSRERRARPGEAGVNSGMEPARSALDQGGDSAWGLSTIEIVV